MLALVGRVEPGRQVIGREVLQSTGFSYVERVTLDAGSSYIAKRGTHMVADEARTIYALRGSPIPMAEMYVAESEGEFLTMLMDEVDPENWTGG